LPKASGTLGAVSNVNIIAVGQMLYN